MMAWYRLHAGHELGNMLPVSLEEIYRMREEGTWKQEDFFEKVLLFSVLSLKQEDEKALKLMEDISRDHLSYPHPHDTPYINDITLQALALQALSNLESRIDSAKKVSDTVLLNLLKKQDKHGLR